MRSNLIVKSCMILATCFLGCDEKDKVLVPEEILTISVDYSAITEYTEDWIIIYDSLGNVIDYRGVEGGDDVVVEMSDFRPGMTLGFTFLRGFIYDDYRFYSLETYLNLKKGETIKIAEIMSGVSGEFGSMFRVDVDGFTSLDQYSLSNKFGFSCSSGAYNNRVDLTCQKFDPDYRYILQLSDDTGDLRYTVLENVKADDSYHISFSEMKPFDKIVDFKFPQSSDVSLKVMGREPGESLLDNGYMLNFHNDNDTHTYLRAGYLNSLTNYSTELSVGYEDFTYEYMNRGSIPDPEIAWPSKNDFNLLSRSILQFSSTVNSPFNWRVSLWEHFSSPSIPARVAWKVFSTSKGHNLSELPAEILSRHPVLSSENLHHSSTIFYTESDSYMDMLNRTLDKRNPQGLLHIGIGLK